MKPARAAVVLGIPLVAAGIALWDPARHGGPPLCPWRAITGTACPGCGLTRAAGAFLHGRWSEAAHLHPLVFLLAGQIAVLWALVVAFERLDGLRPQGPSGPATKEPRAGMQLARCEQRRARMCALREPPAWVIPVLLGVNALAFLAVWSVRWAAGTLPTA